IQDAAICSLGQKDLSKNYQKLKDVKDCVQKGDESNTALANCVGESFLGEKEKYYLGCVTKNRENYSAVAICALSKDLTPEQQIALSCLISTGGVPHAYLACAGGQLFEREITKCWEHGIATEGGCFGKNNEYRKFYDGIDKTVKDAFGENGEGYKLFHWYKETFLTPGQNHEFVKFINHGLNDIKEGPGPNNEFVKASNAVNDALRSVGLQF
ncbi:MAG TPA: hypothetical protein VGL12_07920, partial [Roseiarcus sp.]